MNNQDQKQMPESVRYPLDPIIIRDSYSLIALTIGGMLNEVPVEEYLVELIDREARVLFGDLGREMLRPSYTLPPEEYAEYLAQDRKEGKLP